MIGASSPPCITEPSNLGLPDPVEIHATRGPSDRRAIPQWREVQSQEGSTATRRHHALAQADEVVAADRDPVALRARAAALVRHVVDTVDRRIGEPLIGEMNAANS